LDGLGSHVTLEAIEQASEFGLDMVTLLSHTFNLWMWLASNLSRLLLEKKKTTIVTRNYIEPDKITLAGWVNKTLN